MRIGIDMMEGDSDPGSTVHGSLPALKTFPPDSEIILTGGNSLLPDVGLNSDAYPDVLYQYYTIGTIYSKLAHKISEPKVALLNIGRESGTTYRILSEKGLGSGYFEMFNFDNFGGSPVPGKGGPNPFGHGISC